MEKYNVVKWFDRHTSRSDINCYLTHLTKPNGELDSLNVLLKILKERTLIGSDHKGFISGEHSAVCFQDAPLYGIGQNILHEQKIRQENKSKIRYVAVGLMFSKPYIFNRGGRPVIYGTKEENERLFKNEKWRTVTLDFKEKDNIIDWSHEREWRIKGNLEFKLNEVFVVVPNSQSYKYFIDNAGEEILKEIRGIVTLEPVLT
ncbi:DUF2971 domain-containing protein [Lysinibacillus capsici]|uniref:DUF2971 domain-containing protein n=1 Tax=Lysinibacillus capsici TaxID=2115968 RepID=UPI0032E52CD7